MAIYHLETQIFGRSAGRSAVACAAYRSGQRLFDERTGELHQLGDPSRVVHNEIIAGKSAPGWVFDRATLWNHVEAHERHKDAQLAREWEVALPIELSRYQQIVLVRGWIAAEVTAYGLVADVAFHDKRQPGKAANPHAHIMGTMRPLDAGEWGPKYERVFNKNELLAHWRSTWCEHTNAALVRAGVKAAVTHLSHADRGLDELPTIKEGPGARGMEARGEASERVAANRKIRAHNRRLAQGRGAEPTSTAEARDEQLEGRVSIRRPQDGPSFGLERDPATRNTDEEENLAAKPDDEVLPPSPNQVEEEDVLWELTKRTKDRGR